MKVSYEDAMANLQAMFDTVDRETIHKILVHNKGKMDPTVEDLLKLVEEAGSEEISDDENLFDDSNSPPIGKSHEPVAHSKIQNNNMNFQSNRDSEDLARELQEQQDLEFALKLQESYIDREDGEYEESSNRVNQQHQNNQANPTRPQSNSKPNDAKAKQPKKDFKLTMTEAKTKFSNLFKKKKKGKEVQEDLSSGHLDSTSASYSQSTTEPTITQKKHYSFNEIMQLHDREIISFENPIGGGSVYQYDHPESQEDNTIHLEYEEDKPFDFYNEQKRLGSKAYADDRLELKSYRENDEELSSHFRIDDKSEEESKSEDSPEALSGNRINTKSYSSDSYTYSQSRHRDSYDNDKDKKFDIAA